MRLIRNGNASVHIMTSASAIRVSRSAANELFCHSIFKSILIYSFRPATNARSQCKKRPAPRAHDIGCDIALERFASFYLLIKHATARQKIAIKIFPIGARTTAQLSPIRNNKEVLLSNYVMTKPAERMQTLHFVSIFIQIYFAIGQLVRGSWIRWDFFITFTVFIQLYLSFFERFPLILLINAIFVISILICIRFSD